MNIQTVLDTYTTALVTNAAIKTWCVANYSQAQKIFQGIDPREEPTADDVPAINIFLILKKTGDSLLNYDYGLGVTSVIYNEAKTTTTTSDVVLTKFTGQAHIEAFRKLAETAITEVDTGAGSDVVGLRIDELEIDYEMIEWFPFFKADMIFSFVKDRFQGDDTFA